jgi:hypothetical protein
VQRTNELGTACGKDEILLSALISHCMSEPYAAGLVGQHNTIELSLTT